MAAPSEVTLAFLEYLCLFFSLSACILLKIDERQAKPYMDEIFHVPQAQKFCDGNFYEWDPMITTLPGLYVTTVVSSRPISWLFDVPMKTACKTFWLRSINVAFAFGNVILLKLLIKRIHIKEKDYEDAKGLMTTIAVGLFPVLYFFTFLYYTDAGATFWVLLMYLMSLYGKHWMGAISGCMAVLFRQTNIVWVVFIAGQIAADKLMNYIQPSKKDIPNEVVQSPEFLLITVKQLWKGIKNDLPGLRKLVFDSIADLSTYGLVVVAFVAFIFINGGIVVGAKDDHQVSLHFPQIFYFLSFSTLFAYPHFITIPKIISFMKFLVKRPFLVILFLAVSFPLVWKFTLAHRYLLADNRHYTFYVWAKIFRRHEMVKFAAIPCYLFATWTVCSSLQHKTALWKTVYFVCILFNLIPQMLLEFRYFILPYLILRINMKMSSYYQLVLEMLTYLAINALTIYLFMEKSFMWDNNPDQQRFMW